MLPGEGAETAFAHTRMALQLCERVFCPWTALNKEQRYYTVPGGTKFPIYFIDRALWKERACTRLETKSMVCRC